MPRIMFVLATMLSFMAFTPVAESEEQEITEDYLSELFEYSQSLGQGIEAIEAGDGETALKHLRPLGELGYAEAQFHLGNLYHPVLGPLKQVVKSVKWYRKSAEQGYADGLVALGFLCRR